MRRVYDDPMALADPSVHRLTSAQYEALVDSGALDDEPVELLDGLLVRMSPQSEDHEVVVRTLQGLLLGRQELLAVQMPVRIGDGWAPEPDVSLKPDPRRGEVERPLLVVEVMVTQHREAREKLPGYALARIPQVWLVDVPDRTVEVRRPDGAIDLRRDEDRLDPEVEGIAPFTVRDVFARLSG